MSLLSSAKRKFEVSSGKIMSNQALDKGDIQATCDSSKKTITSQTASDSSHHERNIDDFYVCCDSWVSEEMDMPLGNPIFNLDGLRQALCEFVLSGGHPFSIIEEPGLKKMMSALYPDFNLITSQALIRDALTYQQDERMIVASDLENAPGRICFVLDNWRNGQTGEEYICITACWVDHSWTLQKRIIRLLALTTPFDGVSIAEEILLSLGQWRIAKKAFSFILDDAPYSDSLIGSLKSILESKQALVFSGQFLRMRNYSHIISLLGQSTLKLMDDVLPKIRNTVMHFRHSTPKQIKFYEAAQTSFGLKTTKRLCIDTFVSWDSTFLMLDCFLYYRDVIENFVSNDMGISEFCLTQEEWAKVDELHKFLETIYNVTREVSAPESSTANIYFYTVWRIHKKLVDISNGPPGILSSMVKEVQPEFEKYWSDYHLILSCAAVLDPRMKLLEVGYCYWLLYEEDRAKQMFKTLEKTLYDLFDEYKRASAATSPRVGSSNVSSESGVESVSRRKRHKCWYDEEGAEKFKAKIMKKWANRPSEMKSYLSWPAVDLKKHPDLDVLEFWKDSCKCGDSVILSTMARDILTIPLSVAPLDSGFRTEEQLLIPCRSSLSPKTIEALTCYKDWLRAKRLSTGPTFFCKGSTESSRPSSKW